MTFFSKSSILLAGVAALCISGCSEDTKEKIGLSRSSPDEFKVIKRAPLEMPPDYYLEPPRPGAPRPQELTASEQARQSVFGKPDAAGPAVKTDGESLLLQQAGSDIADPTIRRKIDQESLEISDDSRPVVDRLLNLGSDELPPAKILNPKEEAERLRTQQEGKTHQPEE